MTVRNGCNGAVFMSNKLFEQPSDHREQSYSQYAKGRVPVRVRVRITIRIRIGIRIRTHVPANTSGM